MVPLIKEFMAKLIFNFSLEDKIALFSISPIDKQSHYPDKQWQGLWILKMGLLSTFISLKSIPF